jgi:hypothetical protein
MTLTYPSELNAAMNDYVMFTAHEYRTNRSIPGQINRGGGVGPSVGEPVLLYMPNSTPALSSAQTWGEVKFAGPLGDITQQLAVQTTSAVNSLSAGKVSISDIKSQAKSAFEKIKSQGGAAAGQLGLKFLGGIFGATPNQLQAMQSGRIYNPNVELLYEGPKMRAFSFDFNFIPKTQSETAVVNRIIKQFKSLSAPSKLEASMLKVPCVWTVAYKNGSNDHPYMGEFKRCALVSVSVGHNPTSNTHTTFSDGMPVVTSMNLVFQEVDIILREDHENSKSLQGF